MVTNRHKKPAKEGFLKLSIAVFAFSESQNRTKSYKIVQNRTENFFRIINDFVHRFS
jgi:hypothetical protein